MSLWGKEDQWIASDPRQTRRLSGHVVRLQASCLQGSTKDCVAFCHFWRGSTDVNEEDETSIIHRPFHPYPTRTTSAAIELILWAAGVSEAKVATHFLPSCCTSRPTVVNSKGWFFFPVKPIWCLCVRHREKAECCVLKWLRYLSYSSKGECFQLYIHYYIWLYIPFLYFVYHH